MAEKIYVKVPTLSISKKKEVDDPLFVCSDAIVDYEETDDVLILRWWLPNEARLGNVCFVPISNYSVYKLPGKYPSLAPVIISDESYEKLITFLKGIVLPKIQTL